MSSSSSFQLSNELARLVSHSWSPQPDAAMLIESIVGASLSQSPFLSNLSQRLRDETGTRLIDWIDHLGLPEDDATACRWADVGFVCSTHPFRSEQRLDAAMGDCRAGRVTSDRHGHETVDVAEVPKEADGCYGAVWTQPHGHFPRIHVYADSVRRIVLKVESVIDFLVANGMNRVPVEGSPDSKLRRACISEENQVEVWVIERHGTLSVVPAASDVASLLTVASHLEAFRLRLRSFESDEAGFEFANRLAERAIDDLGKDRTCELFFIAEREYWTGRNRAARIQKARQGAMGLGWANHDHHTYRSSRHCFRLLIAFFERLGFVCRERFYAGREAGWGAQVIEHPVTGVTIFADVDLSPEELSQDFSHEPLEPKDQLGTVGLWCALHGEAFLQAGMHHLECQFDFHAVQNQLRQSGIETMSPFTDYPYLKQAFTRGEQWPVDSRRISRLLNEGLVTRDQAHVFERDGAIGSHLEILQRDDGYKGFNQKGINEIIAATDPRHVQK